MQTTSEAKLLDQLEVTFSKPEGNQAKKFTYHAKKPSGIHEGGIYVDENVERWLLKTENPIFALKEVIASQLYRQVVGQDAAPEVHIIKQDPPKKWIVASKWCDGLEKFDKSSIGLEKMFIASFLIGDVDCLPKNIGSKDNQVFRYDFGAALGSNGKQQKSRSEITSVYELISSVGFNPFDIIDTLDPSEFVKSLSDLDNLEFDWDYWENLYDEALSQDSSSQNIFLDTKEFQEERSIKKQRVYTNDRITTLINLRENLIQNPQDLDDQNENLWLLLVQFYESISPVVKPLIPNYAVTLANKHLASLEETGEHPDFYSSLVEKANNKLSMIEFSKQYGLSLNHGSEEEIEFYQMVKEKSDLIKNEISNNNLQKPNFVEEESDSNGKLSQESFKTAVKNYIAYKDKFFMRWLFTSDETIKARHELEGITKDNSGNIINRKNLTDEERFKIAQNYINENPDKSFSKELSKVMNPF